MEFRRPLLFILLMLAVLTALLIIFSQIGRSREVMPGSTDGVNFTPSLTKAVEVGGGETGEPVFCTQDVKQCPDGSFVGRVPPDCSFAPCPGAE